MSGSTGLVPIEVALLEEGGETGAFADDVGIIAKSA